MCGDIQKNGDNSHIAYQFIPLDKKEFEEKEVDITEMQSLEEIIEKIDAIQDNGNYLKIILTGKRSFEIDEGKILKNLINSRILKIRNQTKLKIDLAKEKNQYTLKGLFLEEAYQAIQDGNLSKEEIEKALEIGLELFD